MLTPKPTQNPLRPWQRRVAWTLIAALANPLSVLPLSLYSGAASARDTDIYLSTTYAGSTAEPAVLLLLDTSDSMNTPEGWREYPGAYDSHVEYLWNDSNMIDHQISDTVLDPANANAKYGYWAGDTAERQKQKDAASAYSKATETGDPGARNVYRNYKNAGWIYWLPADTPETDGRLRSNSFNRWLGGVAQSGFPANVRAGIDYGPLADARSYNQCNDSLEKLLPSTVFAPTPYPRNTGKYAKQPWQRWEPYLDLINGRVMNGDSTYPNSLGGTRTATVEIVTGSVVGTIGSRIRAYTEFLGTAGGGPTYPVRDSYPRSAPFGGVADIGEQGQPIRTQGTSSRSGWTDLKADMGGFNFQNFAGESPTNSVLVEVLKLYDISADTTTALHKAWKGNRDASSPPAFGQMTGTPAYYDQPGTLLRLSATGAMTTTLCTRTCVLDADPGTDGNQGAYSAHDSGTPPQDGAGTIKYWVKNGATCQSTGTSGSDCSMEPAACGTPQNLNNSYTSANPYGCSWSGRSSILVEGTGTYYYGGTCSGSCNGQGNVLGASACASGGSSPNYCDMTLGNITIGSTVYPNAALNSGNGTSVGCTSKSDTTTTCEVREGSLACRYLSNPASACTNQTISSTTPGDSADYIVYPFAAGTNHLVHDCKADNGTTGNPGNGFMTAAIDRTFGQDWNVTNSATGTTAAYTPTDPSASYPNAVDMYSVNYLNWKYGAKGATGAPIGRKTRLQIAKDALTDLVNKTNGIRFGLMVYNKLPNDITIRNTQGSQGGNIVYSIRRMGSSETDSDYVNRASIARAINSVVATGTTPLTEVMYEAYLYFRGEPPLFGTDATPAVGGGTVSAGSDPSAIVAGKYDSPMMSNPNRTTPAVCQKNYVVLISDGGPENDNQADTLVQALTQGPPFRADTIRTLQGTPSTQFENAGLPYGPTDIAYPSNYVWLDELTHFMAKGDMSPGGATATDSLTGVQSVSTYTVGFAGGSSPVLEKAATNGGGAFYEAKDSGELSTALAKAIDTIRDWNPTLAAPTVPISATNRSESSDDIFLAFFRPSLQQSWDGTVKKFKLSSNAAACGLDVDNLQIPLCLTGQTTFTAGGLKNIEEFDRILKIARVRDEAVSYWSDPAAPDGSKPNQGGTGHVLKTASGSTPASRKLYTHLSGSSEPLLTDARNAMSEVNSTITKDLLGDASMTDAMRATILNHARGGDPVNAGCKDADSATVCSTWRTWPHGDVLHSSPAVLTYDGTTVPPVSDMFYMSNDGLLHAVDTATGKEQWAFMPEEYIPKLKSMYENPVGEHLITGDGSPRIYLEDVDEDGKITASDKAYLVFGMRRGGRAVYALDISDRTAPKFMWKVDNSTSGFNELGETWSAPAFTRMRASTDPVVVFGAGYDPVANDQISVTITRSGTTATATTPVDHGFTTGDSVRVSGATPDGYNGAKTITVTSARSFTYTVSDSLHTPPTGTVKVESITSTSTPMGRGVFFVNGETGDLIRSFTPAASAGANTQVSEMLFSIPSEAAPLNTDLDSNGYTDRLYLGDLGGNVWRFDVDSDTPSSWTATKFADLTNGATPRRRIFFPPAVVKQKYQGQRFDAVYVGTGDKENPLRTDNHDLMFMIKDFDTGLATTGRSLIKYSSDPSTSDFYDLTDNLIQFGTTEQQTAAQTALVGKLGWVMRLETGGVDGEKVVNAPSVFFNVLRFGTYSPLASASVCLPPGKGTTYAMNALDGSVVIDTDHSGSITSSDSRVSSKFAIRGFPSDIVTIFHDKKIFSESCTDSNCDPSLLGAFGVGQRIYWFQEPER